MKQSAEQIARQFANANINKKIFTDLVENVKVFGAEGDGNNDDTISVQKAIDSSGLVATPEGTYKVTSLDNKYGREFFGPGKILQNGVLYNSYAYSNKSVFGINYLSSFHKKLMAGIATKIVFSGDSTTQGYAVVSPSNIIDQLVLSAAQRDGFSNVSVKNNGVGGAHTGQWEATFVYTDLADNPDVLVVRWGINDPFYGRTVDQFITSLRNGLQTVRNSRPLSSLAIVLMTPSSTSDTPNGRDEMWYETINPAIRQAAKDYQCCYIDTYSSFQDSRNASDWMDNPFGDGRHIHPLDVANLWIGSLIYDNLFPTLIRVKTGNQLAASSDDITLYIDGTNGNDGNDGSTLAKAFKTIQAGINKLQSTQIINHLVFFNIANGTYNEDVVLKGLMGSGIMAFQSVSSNADLVTIKSLTVADVKIRLFVAALTFTNTTGNGATVTVSPSINFQNCKIIASAAQRGISAESSNVSIDGCMISNRSTAIYADVLSQVYSVNNAGTGNTIALQAVGGTIRKGGTQPSGTTQEQTFNGGMIFDQWLSTVQTPTLLNGWVNFDVSTSQAGFYKDVQGLVYLEGTLKDGSLNVPVFVLPVGYRPSKTLFISVVSVSGYGIVQIYANGNVMFSNGSATYTCLDGVVFRAAQ